MNADTLNAIVAAVKRNLETHTELAPAVFIGNKNEVRIVCGSFSNGPEKDVFAQVIKKIAKEMSADFILFVSESWVLPPEYSQDFMDNRGKYPSVSDHPPKKRSGSFSLRKPYRMQGRVK